MSCIDYYNLSALDYYNLTPDEYFAMGMECGDGMLFFEAANVFIPGLDTANVTGPGAITGAVH